MDQFVPGKTVYAFSSVLYQASSSGLVTTTQQSVNSITETVAQTSSTLGSTGSSVSVGFVVLSSQGTNSYSANPTQTAWQLETVTSSDYASGGSSLEELGSFTAGSYAFGSITYDQDSGDAYTSLDTSVVTQSSTQSTTNSATPGGSQSTIALTAAAALDGGGTLTISSTQSGSTSFGAQTATVTGVQTNTLSITSDADWTLYESGSWAQNSFSLGCVVYEGGSLLTFAQNTYRGDTVVQNQTTAGNPAFLNSGVTSSVSSSGQAAGTTTALITVTDASTLQVTGTYSTEAYETGTYSNGSFNLTCLTYDQDVNSQSSFTSVSTQQALTSLNGGTASFTLGGISQLNGSASSSGSATQSDNLSCYQQATLVLHEEGDYSQGQISLSCFNLTSSSSLTANDTLSSLGTDSSTGSASGGPYSGGGSNSMSQSIGQTQAGTLTELGTAMNGTYTLSLVSFSSQSSSTFAYSKGSQENWSGSFSGSDNLQVTASGAESYAVSGRGSFVNNFLSLSSYSLVGGSNGTYNMADSGSMGTTGYSHSDVWSEGISVSEQGSLSSSSGWYFTHYDTSQTTNEVLSDTVGSSQAAVTLNDSASLTGTGRFGIQTDSSTGNYNWNDREYSYDQSSTASASLVGPSLPQLNPQVYTGLLLNSGGQPAQAATSLPAIPNNGQAPSSTTSSAVATAFVVGGAVWQTGNSGTNGAVAATAAQVQAGGGSGAAQMQSQASLASAWQASATSLQPALSYDSGADDPSDSSDDSSDAGTTWQAQSSSGSQGIPGLSATMLMVPQLGGLSTGTGNTLLSTSGALLTQGSWGWLTQLQATLLQAVQPAYQTAIFKAQTTPKLNPLTMYASGAWSDRSAALPPGTEISSNLWAQLGQVEDYIAGVLDSLTNGLTRRLTASSLTSLAMGLIGVPWTQSVTSQNQSPPTVNYDSAAYQQGLYTGQAIGVALTLMGGGATGLALLVVNTIHVAGVVGAAANVAEAVSQGNWKAAGQHALGFVSALVRGATGCQGTATAVGLAIGTVSGVASAVDRFSQGDVFGGVLDLMQAASSLYAASRSCFTARMLIDYLYGKIRADEIRVGDLVWARDERDPEGKPQLKRVLAVFVRSAQVLLVSVADQVLETTAEHPFWVHNRNEWLAAAFLQPGDVLMTRDGLLVAVDSVEDSGRVETVYNWEIEDYHTYFVSADEDGGSVWAHNTYGEEADHRPYTRDGNFRWRDARGRFTSEPGISRQKQNGHIQGTSQYNNRIRAGKPTSSFSDRATADSLTMEAWARGTPVEGRPNVKEHDFGREVGIGPNGGRQNTVRVHQDNQGRIHGHPSGSEF